MTRQSKGFGARLQAIYLNPQIYFNIKGAYELTSNTEIVVLTSGGPDSSTTLLRFANEGHTVYPFIIQYEKRLGQIEYKSLKSIINWLRNKFGPLIKDEKKIELSALWDLHIQNNLNQVTDFIPFRNLIFASFGAMYGVENGIYDIALGLVAEGGYSDCTEHFKDQLEKVLYESVRKKINVHTPFINEEKADIIKYGKKDDFPYELTYSCYRGGPIHCGQCNACILRKNAFKLAKITDPTEYEK